MNKDCSKFSKIDRILVSSQFIDKWPNAKLLALPREISDQCPLILNTRVEDFGPIPFKFYNSWLKNVDLLDIVERVCNEVVYPPSNASKLFKNKLKELKKEIRKWRVLIKNKEASVLKELRTKVNIIEIKAESTTLEPQDIHDRTVIMKDIMELEHSKILDLKQKAKVKWAVEGVENSKFFHGLVNNNMKKSRIHGLIIDGTWNSNPLVKHVLDFYCDKFKEKVTSRPRFASSLFKTLSSEEVSLLTHPISLQEIKEAVWCCDGNKSHGLDGFTFKFIKKYWDTFASNIYSFIK